MSFFKYLKKEHYDLLVELGIVRIGTLKGYQSTEHGSKVGDPMEGSKSFYGAYETLKQEQIDNQPQNAPITFSSSDVGSKYVCLNNNVISESNYFIFSVSAGYKEEDHINWNKEESYDFSYKIILPNNFFRKVTRALNEITPVTFLGVFNIQYYDEAKGVEYFSSKNKLPAFMLKDEEYSDQREVRAVWRPKEVNISAINISDERLNSYIEPFVNITEKLKKVGS